MGRKVLAVVVALIVAWGVIMIFEMANSAVVLSPTIDVMSDPAKMREFWNNVPATSFMVVLLGYIVGAFGGGFIVTKMARQVSPGNTLPILVGVILMIGALLNFFVVLPGQPIWFVALSLIVFIPMSMLGYRFAR
jgi:hypothetical protein